MNQIILVAIIKDNVIESCFEFDNSADAELKFIELCNEKLSNFDEYTSSDIDSILDNGYEKFNNGAICIWHITPPSQVKDNEELIRTAKITTDFSPDIKEDDEVTMEIDIHGNFHFSIAQHGLCKNDIRTGIEDALDVCLTQINKQSFDVSLTNIKAVIYDEEN